MPVARVNRWWSAISLLMLLSAPVTATIYRYDFSGTLISERTYDPRQLDGASFSGFLEFDEPFSPYREFVGGRWSTFFDANRSGYVFTNRPNGMADWIIEPIADELAGRAIYQNYEGQSPTPQSDQLRIQSDIGFNVSEVMNFDLLLSYESQFWPVGFMPSTPVDGGDLTSFESIADFYFYFGSDLYFIDRGTLEFATSVVQHPVPISGTMFMIFAGALGLLLRAGTTHERPFLGWASQPPECCMRRG